MKQNKNISAVYVNRYLKRINKSFGFHINHRRKSYNVDAKRLPLLLSVSTTNVCRWLYLAF